MNYGVVIQVLAFLFTTVLWFALGRKVYNGPVTEVLGVETFVADHFRQVETVGTEKMRIWKYFEYGDP